MGATELLERIRKDGRERAAVIRSEKESALAEIRSRTTSELEQIEAETRARADDETARIVERARGRAALTVRNAKLAARWQVLDRVVATTERVIVEGAGYEELIAGLVRKHAGPDSVVRLSEADISRFGSRLSVRHVDPATITGGVLVRNGRRELNFVLRDALVAECEAQASDLSRLLFPEG